VNSCGACQVDPLVYVGATLIFVATGLAACCLPARRAVAIDATEVAQRV